MFKALYKSLLSISFLFFITASAVIVFTQHINQKPSTSVLAVNFQKPAENIIFDLNNSNKSRLYEKNINIFTYHYVEYVKDNNDYLRKSLNIEPRILEEQLKLIKLKGYKDIFIKEVPNILQNKEDNNKYIALTFDDGYKNFYEQVFPLIKKYNTKVTLYVVPSFLNKKDYLSYSQLIEISQSNIVEIGSHGITHKDLLKYNKSEYSKEIFESKKYLEDILNKRIYTFSYPYGKYNEEMTKVVERNGYIAAVSTDNGYTQNGNNLFNLQRIRAGGLFYLLN